jgi:hypothetical protein
MPFLIVKPFANKNQHNKNKIQANATPINGAYTGPLAVIISILSI